MAKKFAYVSNAGGPTTFEIHAPGCAHLRKLGPFADVTVLSATSAQALVDDEVAEYQYQDQGYTQDDFRILGCAKKHEGA